MTTYSLSPAAYTLPLLHAAAHPSATVSGVLLGTVSGSSVSLTDAIPIIHRYAALSPTTELGIDLAKASAAKEGKAVLGYYVAREGGENTLGRVDERILAALRKEQPQALGLVLDNARLTSGAPAYNTFVPASADTVALPARSVVEGALKAVRDGLHRKVRDLDDHLDDSSADWTNQGVVSSIP